MSTIIPPEQETVVTQTKKPLTNGKLIATVAIVGVLSAAFGGGAGALAVTVLNENQTSTTQTSTTTQNIESEPVLGTVADVVNNTQNSIVTIMVAGNKAAGTGSGVVVDDKGNIVTNAHVVTLGGVTDRGEITIQLADGSTAPATLVGIDTTSDLAVINTTAPGLKPITFGNSDNVQVGDTTIAVGSPLGLSGTVTTGIVSALNRPITVPSSELPTPQNNPNNNYLFQPAPPQQQVALNVIQTDAAINPGNSGGALLNSAGELIGVNVAIASTSEGAGNIGVGFAVPSNYAKQIIDSIITTGEATHGYIGMNVQDAFENGFASGAEITSIEPGSPADKTGLKPGDIITDVNNLPITSAAQLVATIKQTPPGETVEIKFYRGGETQVTQSQLTEKP